MKVSKVSIARKIRDNNYKCQGDDSITCLDCLFDNTDFCVSEVDKNEFKKAVDNYIKRYSRKPKKSFTTDRQETVKDCNKIKHKVIKWVESLETLGCFLKRGDKYPVIVDNEGGTYEIVDATNSVDYFAKEIFKDIDLPEAKKKVETELSKEQRSFWEKVLSGADLPISVCAECPYLHSGYCWLEKRWHLNCANKKEMKAKAKEILNYNLKFNNKHKKTEDFTDCKKNAKNRDVDQSETVKDSKGINHKVLRWVKRLDISTYGDLVTKGRVYPVIKEDGNIITILNDSNEVGNFHSNKFKKYNPTTETFSDHIVEPHEKVETETLKTPIIKLKTDYVVITEEEFNRLKKIEEDYNQIRKILED